MIGNKVIISWPMRYEDSLEAFCNGFFLKYVICIKVINDRIKKGIVDIERNQDRPVRHKIMPLSYQNALYM